MLEDEINRIYDNLSNSDKLQIIESTKEGFKYTWRIDFSFHFKGNKYNISFDISIPENFPNSLPRVDLFDDFFCDYGYLPHVEMDKNGPYLCLYDKEAYIARGREVEFFRELIDKAKKEIKNGISGKNFADYQEEFFAYWNKQYPNSQCSSGLVLYGDLQQNINNSKIDSIEFEPKINNYDLHIFALDSCDGKAAKINLATLFENKKSSRMCIYCGDWCDLTKEPLYPPFVIMKCNYILKIVKKQRNTIFTMIKDKYNHNSKRSMILLFSQVINEDKSYFGVILPEYDDKHNGFRTAFDSLLANINPLERVSIKNINNQKLNIRTQGHLSERHSIKTAIIGCGSIGCVLLDMLIDTGFNKISLIDKDEFNFENIKRHALPFNYIGENKAASLQKLKTQINPFLDISSHADDALHFLKSSDMESIELCFIAIGNENVEREIRNIIYSKAISIPIVFVWIEPYCIAGHCLYVKQPNKEYIEKLFNEEGLFLYNAIKKCEYLNGNSMLSKKESGCQSSYVPYSHLLIKQFIYSLSDKLLETWSKDILGVKAISWVGQISKATEINVKISKEYKDKEKFCLIEWPQ